MGEEGEDVEMQIGVDSAFTVEDETLLVACESVSVDWENVPVATSFTAIVVIVVGSQTGSELLMHSQRRGSHTPSTQGAAQLNFLPKHTFLHENKETIQAGAVGWSDSFCRYPAGEGPKKPNWKNNRLESEIFGSNKVNSGNDFKTYADNGLSEPPPPVSSSLVKRNGP
jgi:hypothetical protein